MSDFFVFRKGKDNIFSLFLLSVCNQNKKAGLPGLLY